VAEQAVPARCRLPVKERSKKMNLRTYVWLTEIKDTSHWEPQYWGGGEDWVVVDTSLPQTEEYYYGSICRGCSSREDAEQYIRDYNTAAAQDERVARWKQDEAFQSLMPIEMF
jgi:hypothetical protein